MYVAHCLRAAQGTLDVTHLHNQLKSCLFKHEKK